MQARTEVSLRDDEEEAGAGPGLWLEAPGPELAAVALAPPAPTLSPARQAADTAPEAAEAGRALPVPLPLPLPLLDAVGNNEER